MKFSTLLPLQCLIVTVFGQSRWGPYIEFTSPYIPILEVETTLYLPRVPSPQQDTLLIWMGMPTDQMERYQATIASYFRKRASCGATAGQWCAYGRVMKAVGKQVAVGPAEAINGIVVNFKYNPATGRTLQRLSSPNRPLTAYESAMGKPKSWRTGIECQENCGGITVGAHSYRNTTIKLGNPDPNFPSGVLLPKSIKTSPFQSYDGGRTWFVSQIQIPDTPFD